MNKINKILAVTGTVLGIGLGALLMHAVRTPDAVSCSGTLV